MRILFLLLFVVPLIELYFLIQVGNVIGALPTVLLTIFTAVLGVFLMRSQGIATLQNAQMEMAAGKSPQTSMLEGVFIFLGGVFLFFPGLISDSIGLLFLVPFIRRFLIKQSVKGMQSSGRYRYQTRDSVYEGEWSEKATQTHKTLKGEVLEGEVLDKKE
ncbi:membrane protein [Thiomicrorhabdus immobilis]|uniref:Membrane protein n=1 Tax=Thiomicrorhabdus immobilis TaxID=2791037 RepID=A0ABM7MEY1_9GAMM|nr:FxsA family protein [Thiomicrorhabdus immobilis]BCN93987.1 membrane protein [Thiomicrorhabdus immobilis]